MPNSFLNKEFIVEYLNKALSVGLKVLIVLVLFAISWLLAKIMITRLEKLWKNKQHSIEDQKRTETLISIVWVFIKILLVLLAIMLVLSQMGINLAPLLATAGLGGLAIGFGAQTLVKDLLSGFFILLENQIRVGDVVQVAGCSGRVERISLRTVTLRDLGGNVHIIPHSSIDKVTNMTMEFSYYVFDIGVAYREDTDQVVQVLKGVSDRLMKDDQYKDLILESLEILGVDQFADSAIIIKCRIKTLPIHQWTIGREMNRRIKKAFDQAGIEIPFPHRTLVYAQGVPGESEIRKAS